MEGVEDHLEAVGLLERGVAPAVGDDDLPRLPVVANGGDVEGIVGGADEDLGALGRRLPLVGGGLPETGGRGDPSPGGVGEHLAVDRRGGGEGRRLKRRRRGGGSGGGQGRRQDEAGEVDLESHGRAFYVPSRRWARGGEKG